MFLEMALFAQVSAACASGDSIPTLASVAKTESEFNTLAIHDNSSSATYRPANEDEARRIARTLIEERGHSVDLGLMQINSANLPRLGLSIDDAFDACHSIAAGARILKDGYQQALRVAFSRYNTGDSVRGFANGYVAKIEAASQNLPAIGTSPLPPPTSDHAAAAPLVKAAPLRSWDVWDQDDQDSAVVAWDASHQGTPAPTAPIVAAPAAMPTEPARPSMERVVMLQSVKSVETP